MKLTIITIIHFFHLRLKCVERAMIVSQFFILFFFLKKPIDVERRNDSFTVCSPKPLIASQTKKISLL